MDNEQDVGLFAINEARIQHEFMRVASDLARWNQKLAEATEAVQLAEHKLEYVEAHIYHHIRIAAQADGEKISENAIQSRIKLDDLYRAQRDTLIKASKRLLEIKGAVQAIITKRDMLISLGAHLREEMKGDPSIRSEKIDWSTRNE